LTGVTEIAEDDLVRSTRALVAKVNSASGSWRFRDASNHAVATAGMTRSAGLLGEALDLAVSRPSIGANILVRSAFECWLVGAWALFGGEAALLGIERERLRYEKLLVERNSLPSAVGDHLGSQHLILAEAASNVLGGAQPLIVKYEQMAKVLSGWIKLHTRDHEDADVIAIYDLLYRAVSTFDAHPWKAVGQYLKEGGLGWRVEPQPPWNDPVRTIGAMASYVALLGRWIDEERGHSDPDWDRLARELSGGTPAEGSTG
jgi:hypothetical protein